jgi:heat shock protein HtpX
MKRIFLFLATNLAVLVLVSIVLNVVLPLFGIRLDQGGNAGLLVMAAIFGFGGASSRSRSPSGRPSAVPACS